MSGRVRRTVALLLIGALASATLAAVSCTGPGPAAPEGTERIRRGFAVIGYLEVDGQPVGSHVVSYLTWKTDTSGHPIEGTSMQFERTTGSNGEAVGTFGYDLLFEVESSTYRELVRCQLSTTYNQQDLTADVHFTQTDLAVGDTVKTVSLAK